MKLGTLQWNIGGGRIRLKDSDSSSEAAYDCTDLGYFAKLIGKYDPNIVTLQETHKDQTQDQGGELADQLGYRYFVTDSYDESHIEVGQRLSQSILSKHPITVHKFDFLFNPKFRLTRPDRTVWISHNKGVTFCSTTLPNGKTLDIMTVHMLPFRKFEADLNSDAVQVIFRELAEKIPNDTPLLFQGDFNIDSASLKGVLPDIFKLGLEEVILTEPTTPKGRIYDHVLYKGMKYISSTVIQYTLTDHYPVYSTFEFI